MMFLDLFPVKKPVFGMLHFKGESREDKLERCLKEAEIYRDNGVDAVIVEDYFGDAEDVKAGLELLNSRGGFTIGVNILDNWELSWEYAKRYGAPFIQVDSVAGHLPPLEDLAYGKMIDEYMSEGGIFVIGGVRFKYKPVLSGNDLETDLKIGMKRCHALAVTGEGTGMDSPTRKIREFRRVCGDFPLVVAAGMNADTVFEKLSLADAAIVGSTFKDTRKDNGDVSADHVREFMDKVYELRSTL